MFSSQSKTVDAPPSLHIIERRLLLLGFAFISILGGRGNAQQAAPSSDAMLSNAVRVLAYEKSAAEQYAVILATVGNPTPRGMCVASGSMRMPRQSSTQ